MLAGSGCAATPGRSRDDLTALSISDVAVVMRGYGATAARLTPDQKVGSSNLSALISLLPVQVHYLQLGRITTRGYGG